MNLGQSFVFIQGVLQDIYIGEIFMNKIITLYILISQHTFTINTGVPIRLIFEALKFCIFSFPTDNKHFYFRCSHYIYDINFPFISFAEFKSFRTGIMHPIYCNLFRKSFSYFFSLA